MCTICEACLLDVEFFLPKLQSLGLLVAFLHRVPSCLYVNNCKYDIGGKRTSFNPLLTEQQLRPSRTKHKHTGMYVE